MLRTEINGRYSKNRKEIAKIGRNLPRNQRRKEVWFTAAVLPVVDCGLRLVRESLVKSRVFMRERVESMVWIKTRVRAMVRIKHRVRSDPKHMIRVGFRKVKNRKQNTDFHRISRLEVWY